MAYKPIESYGVIGDMHSVALVSTDGSIDWCCLPNFDSPSVFAAILDDKKGGYFQIRSCAESRNKQMYFPETNVLMTRFLSREGVGEVVDLMPIQSHQESPERHDILRIVRSVRGSVRFRMDCLPAFDYARTRHNLELKGKTAIFRAPGLSLALCSTCDLKRTGDGVSVEFILRDTETATFVLEVLEDGLDVPENLAAFGEEALHETISVWKNWVSRCQYTGRWREMVMRSALVLKLLTFHPTGAIVASPTCGLPEEIGGVRNWDYRYTWIRDAAFTVYAFLRLGYYEEASRFMNWLQGRATEHETDGPLQVMYGIDGRHDLTETTLDHLDGYCGSRPVRIGNAASEQLQLDIYGELIDSIYLFNKYAQPISYDLWVYLRRMLEWVCENWQRPDHGIWEQRIEPKQYVYSKVQCWVALDRGLRIAEKRGLPADFARMRQESSRIYETIMREGWSESRKAFVQYFGSDAMDANALLMPLMMFLSPSDPKMLMTLDRIMSELVSDSLVYRYEIGKAAGDGLPGIEGTFSMCTFWLVEVLARAGRLDDARVIFEKMLTYANHLGLFAEEIGPTGEALGNFPQAFTHLGLISAAFDLDRSLNARHRA